MPTNDHTKTKKGKPIVVIGNWKMNPQQEDGAVKLFADIKKLTNKKNAYAQTGIAAPFVFIPALAAKNTKSRFALGAQDVSSVLQGTHTGEVSIPMLKGFGVTQIIIGHSERRAAGETDEQVRDKTHAVLKAGLTAVVCIGEHTRDAQGDYFSFVQSQIRSILQQLPKVHLKRLMLAYEPIWAIGTGITATAEDVHEMKLFIQKCITDHFDRTATAQVRILYGGSVDDKNAQSLLEEGHADGFLIGGASLKPAVFAHIIKISDDHYATT